MHMLSNHTDTDQQVQRANSSYVSKEGIFASCAVIENYTTRGASPIPVPVSFLLPDSSEVRVATSSVSIGPLT